MNIKSLLIGSAAAMVVSTGAQAADAIVYADPEPMEYVRICDVYGAGFYYIPGTETCLRIGGYVRFQAGTNTGANGYATHARFTPTFDARTATEWGTLRAFAEIDFNYYSRGGTIIGGAAGQSTTVVAAFIDVGDNNFLRIGRSYGPYSGWIRGGTTLRGGGFHLGSGSGNQIGYFFNTTNTTVPVGRAGFSGFIAAVDRGAGNVNSNTVDVDAGIGYGWQGGFVRLAAYYDAFPTNNVGPFVSQGSWGAKAAVGITAGIANLQLAAHYQDRPDFVTSHDLQGANWMIAGNAQLRFSPNIDVNASVEWYNQTVYNVGTANANWIGALNVSWQPFGNNSLQVIPEVQYTRTYANQDLWAGTLRINRNF